MTKKKPGKKKAAGKKAEKKSPGKTPADSPLSLVSPSADDDRWAPRKRSPLEEAQNLMYDAWDAPTRKKAVALANKALTISADCADAYNLLALETAESFEEAIALYRKGVEVGERALGREVFEEAVGYFWGMIETRPYMRALAGLAENLWQTGENEEAARYYWEMLRLNPGDNQGIRYHLLPCLIELGRDEEAERLYKQYKTDGMAQWMYGRALLDFRKYGDSPAARRSLKSALKQNQHVPAYLLGRKKIPRNLPEYYGWGDENEAVFYAYGDKAAWESTPGALEWLAAKVK